MSTVSTQVSYNIVTSFDEKYIKYGVALIASLWANNSIGNLKISVLDTGICIKSKNKLSNWSKKLGINIQFYLIDNNFILKYLGDDFVVMYPISYYARLLAPYIFNSDVKKILYLDADVICLNNLVPIFDIDLDGFIISAVRDSKYKSFNYPISNNNVDTIIPNYKELNFCGNEPYFNSGVMIINVPLWKQREISKNVFNISNKYKEHVVLWDQYGLNIVLSNCWKELDSKWNNISHKTSDDIVFRHFAFIKPDSCKYMYSDRNIFFNYISITPWKPLPIYFIYEFYYWVKKYLYLHYFIKFKSKSKF